MSNETYTAVPLREALNNSSSEFNDFEQGRETRNKNHTSSSSSSSSSSNNNNNNNNNIHNKNTTLHILGKTACCALLFLGFVLIGCNHHEKNYETIMSKEKNKKGIDDTIIQPTLLPGGGRDWKLNLVEGTISPKHDDSFVLGAHPYSPLVLTNKGESNKITFSTTDELEPLKQGGSVSLTGIGLQYPDENLKGWENWYYTEGAADDSVSVQVRYLDNNFLAAKDGEGNDMVLDISFWKMVRGNTVNFVRAQGENSSSWWSKWFKPKTLQYGGGRDWVFNMDDGTISPKHAPYLVLGKGPTRLMLAKKDSSSTMKFDNLEGLSNGESVKLSFTNSDKSIGQLKDEEQYVGPWRYIESNIVHSNDAGVNVKYLESNYIATAQEGVEDEKALVLDISYWKMFSGNTVNFVGGWTWTGNKQGK